MPCPIRTAVAGLAAVILAPPALAQEASAFELASHGEYGLYLTDPAGRPVYAFISERGTATDGLPSLESCGESCREDWPPVTVSDTPTGAQSLRADLFGRVSDEVAGEVATYNSWPLFYYAHEDLDTEGPDGHAISTYGGWWALIAPDGEPIRTGVMPGANVDG